MDGNERSFDSQEYVKGLKDRIRRCRDSADFLRKYAKNQTGEPAKRIIKTAQEEDVRAREYQEQLDEIL